MPCRRSRVRVPSSAPQPLTGSTAYAGRTAVSPRRLSSKGLATAIVATALLGIGIAAAIDAARSGKEGTGAGKDAPGTTSEATASEPQAETKPPDETLVAALKTEGVRGVLYYSDTEDDCRLRAVSLPELVEVPPPKLRACRFELPPHPEPSATFAGVTWSPSGDLAAYCLRGRVVVVSAIDATIQAFRGCAPAWKPNGTLTLVRSGEVVDCGDGGQCRRVIFSKHELRAALERHSPTERAFRPLTFRFREIAWFSDTRLGAIVRSQRSGDIAVVLERASVVNPTAIAFGRLSLGTMSPRRTEVVVRTDRPLLPLWLLHRRGSFTLPGRWLPPSLGSVDDEDVRALTWSPDEQWTAIATRASVYLFEREGDQSRTFRLPLTASDLTWRWRS